MKYLCGIMLISLFLSCSGYQEQFEVTVVAGANDRFGTPVYVDVSLPAVDASMTASVVRDGKSYPAQIENMGNANARIWWIVDRLAAGTSATYQVRVGTRPEAPEFIWSDSPGNSSELRIGERPVLKYMYAAYHPERLDETWNPYHHVYTPDGQELLTKGAGGLYPHHRGIFFGYSKISVGDSSYNIWADSNGEHSLHQSFVYEHTGPVFGGHDLRIVWKDRQGNAIIAENRKIRTFLQPHGTLLIDVQTELNTLAGDIRLDGDRQHAGVQFRARNDVAESEDGTTFLRPEAWKDLPPEQAINDATHCDLPWNAIQFGLTDKRYTVAYLSAPDNPDGADFSERKYGRFGEFIPWTLTESMPLSLHYRFWITESEGVERGDIESRYRDLAMPPIVELSSN